MKFNHYIFDFDGTLADSEHTTMLLWEKLLHEYGMNIEISALRNDIFGLTVKDTIKKLNINDFDGKFEEKLFKMGLDTAKDILYFDGIVEMLEKIKKSVANLGIVSSRANNEFTFEMFSHLNLDKYFPVVILKEATKRHKPNKEPIEKYMEVTGASKDECIYIGDMPTDVMSANAAGIKSGIVLWNGSSKPCEEADYSFNTPDDILNL